VEHRVDAHHHLWDLTVREMPWIDPVDMEAIDRSFGVADLAEGTARAGIVHTVVVEAASRAEETEELLALSEREPRISGVVGFVDLTAPDVGAEIDRLRGLPGGDRLVGIRSPVQDEPDPRWLLRPDVIEGLRAVAARSLVYDLLLVPPQIEAAIGAAAQVSDGRFVVDHLAKPEIVDRQWEPWASAIAALADHEQVCCKLSGMVTQADWTRWTIDDLRPYAAHVIEQFGPDRILFGTDWPVCTLAASYDTVVDVAEQLTASLSDSERAAIFGGNATRVYALEHRET
jgi:L-fuconolactonase